MTRPRYATLGLPFCPRFALCFVKENCARGSTVLPSKAGSVVFMRHASAMNVTPSPAYFNHMKLCTCERVAENGDFGSCFRAPFHRTQPAALTFFKAPSAKPVRFPRASTAGRGSRFRHTPPPLPPSDLFWLLELCPQNRPLSIYSASHG
jgi:hypothetical protein